MRFKRVKYIGVNMDNNNQEMNNGFNPPAQPVQQGAGNQQAFRGQPAQPVQPVQANGEMVFEGTVEKPNIVVVGNSGVGKSTLINSLFQTYVAETSIGEATTKELRVYENDALGFRIIDTIGFEPGLMNQNRAVLALKKWSRDSIKNDDPTHQINMIWYCIDGTSRKMFKKNIDMLARATSVWKSVPIIVVITKSYSKPEREENVRMVYHAFKNHKKLSENLKSIVPVVASTYKIDTDLNINVTPDGLGELLAETVKYLPDGVNASMVDKKYFYLQQKRAMAHSVVGASALAGLTVGLVPIPFPDGTILTPLEVGEIKSLSKIYGVEFDKNTELIQTIINAGTAGIVAKTALNAIKAIPGLNIAGDVLNGIVAGVIVAALGEGSVYIFEQIYTGQKSVADTEWVKNFLDSKVATSLAANINVIVKEYTELLASGKKVGAKDVMMIIMKNIKVK